MGGRGSGLPYCGYWGLTQRREGIKTGDGRREMGDGRWETGGGRREEGISDYSVDGCRSIVRKVDNFMISKFP